MVGAVSHIKFTLQSMAHTNHKFAATAMGVPCEVKSTVKNALPVLIQQPLMYYCWENCGQFFSSQFKHLASVFVTLLLQKSSRNSSQTTLQLLPLKKGGGQNFPAPSPLTP